MLAESNRLDDLTTDELSTRITDPGVALVAVGASEPHGAHLPLGTDNRIASHIADRLGTALGAVVFPPVCYGTVQVLYDFRRGLGTVSLHPDVLKDLVTNIGTEVARIGFRALIIVNGHLPNSPALSIAAFEIKERSGIGVGLLEWWNAAREVVVQAKGSARGTHGDEVETSLAMAAGMEPKVALEDADQMGALFSHVTPAQLELYERGIVFTRDLSSGGWVSRHGNMGDPRLATQETGEAIVSETVRGGAGLAKVLLQL